jgi:hypothetical protein
VSQEAVPSPGVLRHVRRALSPEPAPLLLRAGIAVVVDMVVVYVAVSTALQLAGHPAEGLTHATLPAVFGGFLAFLGSLGGSLRSGLLRAGLLSLVTLPLTLLAIAVRDVTPAAGLAMAGVAAGTGWLAWHGEPWATLGSVLLYMFFLPLVFGAGAGVPLHYLLLGFAVMIGCTLALRAIAALVPKRQRPPRVLMTDGGRRAAGSAAPDPAPAAPVPPAPRPRFALVAQPKLGRLHRTTLRSAIALGAGAAIMSATRDHNAVWVLMTLIALVPPAMPLTIDRVLQRLLGTVLAMIVLTVIDVLVPAGPLRLIALAPGIVVTVAFLRRSYALSVIGVSTVAVLSYAQVTVPLGEALLYRGLDTVIGAVIAIAVTLVIPVGSRPKPVWAHPA